MIHRYEGELPLYHLDLYRLAGAEDLAPLALEEMMEEEAAFMIEWGDPAKEVLADTYLEIEFNRGSKRRSGFLPFIRWGNVIVRSIIHYG